MLSLLARTLRWFRMTANYRPSSSDAQEKSDGYTIGRRRVLCRWMRDREIGGCIPLLTAATLRKDHGWVGGGRRESSITRAIKILILRKRNRIVIVIGEGGRGIGKQNNNICGGVFYLGKELYVSNETIPWTERIFSVNLGEY